MRLGSLEPWAAKLSRGISSTLLRPMGQQAESWRVSQVVQGRVTTKGAACILGAQVWPCLCRVHCSRAGIGKDETGSLQCWTGPSGEWPPDKLKRKHNNVCMPPAPRKQALKTILLQHLSLQSLSNSNKTRRAAGNCPYQHRQSSQLIVP